MPRRKKAPFVLIYDFDGTLSPGNMQEYNFVPKLGVTPKEFWQKAKESAKKHQADEILAYMRLMIEEANQKGIPISKQNFADFGKNIEFFPGVDTWFDRINEYGNKKRIDVEHYIISSGLREMIQGTSIAKYFKKIYASGFMFDHNQIAYWPALAVNYTTKTQYLFRINKNSLDEHDNSVINKFTPHNERPVPFKNMVFIGDGETDIPCMRLVKDLGGHSIAVYHKGKRGALGKAKKLLEEGRATLALPADYTNESDIEKAVMAMIDKIASDNILAKL